MKGAGFGVGELQLAGGRKDLPSDLQMDGVSVTDNEHAEFLPPSPELDPVVMFEGGWLYLKVKPSAGVSRPVLDHLETNRLTPPAVGGEVSVFVGKTFDEMGRPNNPYQTEADPLPGIDVTWRFNQGVRPVTGSARSDPRGMVRIKGVPFGATVTVTARGRHAPRPARQSARDRRSPSAGKASASSRGWCPTEAEGQRPGRRRPDQLPLEM